MLAACVRSALRGPDDSLDILVFRSGDPFDSRLAATLSAHNIWVLSEGIEQSWPSPPANVVLLDEPVIEHDYDLVIAPFSAPAIPLARRVSAGLHAPLIALFHAPPPARTSPGRLARERALTGHVSMCPSKEIAASWGFGPHEATVIPNWQAGKLRYMVELIAAQPYELKWSMT
jgi:hypothetical protein